MEVIIVALGVGFVLTVIWGAVVHLLQMVKIEELEQSLKDCELRGKPGR